MNAQQEAVALWIFLEQRGFGPSIRSVGRALRDQGLKFRDIDLQKWIFDFREAAGKNREAKNEHTGSSGEKAGSGFARAAKVSLIKASTYHSYPTDTPDTLGNAPKRPRRMKQAALDLGSAAPPEIDYDKTRLQKPDDLPEQFPDPLDELQALAESFSRAFAGCRSPEAVRKARKFYTDTLAVFRQRGTPVSVAWDAFTQAVLAQGGKPLFGPQAKTALGYLPSGRRPFAPAGPRIDSCGCPLPAGTAMPRLRAGETAHWDGDEFVYGTDRDLR